MIKTIIKQIKAYWKLYKASLTGRWGDLKMNRKKTLTETIRSLNMNALKKFVEALSAGMEFDMGKEIILSRYGDDEWIEAIRKKDWKKIKNMYTSTRFETVAKVGKLIGEARLEISK